LSLDLGPIPDAVLVARLPIHADTVPV